MVCFLIHMPAFLRFLRASFVLVAMGSSTGYCHKIISPLTSCYAVYGLCLSEISCVFQNGIAATVDGHVPVRVLWLLFPPFLPHLSSIICFCFSALEQFHSYSYGF